MSSKQPFLKQKLELYFDANFPLEVIDVFRNERRWKKKTNLNSAYDDGNEKKDDTFLFNLCRKRGFVLVTLDRDFMDDQRYPFSGIPGIVRVVAGKNDITSIQICLVILLNFLSQFPRPKIFMGNTKFQVSLEGCVIRGRDAKTSEIKQIIIQAGDSVFKVMEFFNY